MRNQVAMLDGALELKGLYQTFALRGLFIATILHVAIIGSYYAAMSLQREEPKQPAIVVRIDQIGPPPSTKPIQTTPSVSIASPAGHPPIANPVMVPDAEISPEATIADQGQINELHATDSLGSGNNNYVFVSTPAKIEVETPPDSFTAVEKQPVPIVSPAPAYPEIPQRAGIEGTVWVRIWVTKEGRARKAEVQKSDSDLFNQAAVDAAMKWVFTPAVMNSGPVAVWVSIPFRFRLHEVK